MFKRMFFIVLFFIYYLDIAYSIVSGWGELCNFTEECGDHRMECVRDKFNISKCDCDRFHDWKGAANGCVQVYDVETILNMTIKISDGKGDLEKGQESIFFGHKVAGFFVMSVGLLCPIVVAFYCCHMRRKDRILHKELKEIRERVDKANHRKQRKSLGSCNA